MEDLIKIIKSYETPKAALELLRTNPPLFIAGVTASGKNTIVEEIAKNTKYRHVVSHTTRSIRSFETNGKQYWFVSPDEFARMLRNHEFIEAKLIHADTVYGTSIRAYREVVKQNCVPMLEVDVQGVTDLMRAVPQARPLFLIPPNFEIWMQRIHNRSHITKEDIKKRLKSAKQEIVTVIKDDRFRLIINDKLEDTVNSVLSSHENQDRNTKSVGTAKQLLVDINNFLGQK